jgi:hypothetical protein
VLRTLYRLAGPLIFLTAAACTTILGVDFDERFGAVGDDGGARDGSVALDDSGAIDAGDFDANADYLAQQEALAKRRVRVDDAPASIANFLASSSWLYWNDAAQVGHSYRPKDKVRRDGLPLVHDANDDVVLTRNVTNRTVKFSRAADGVALATLPETLRATFMLRQGAVFFDDESGTSRIYTWSAASPTVRVKKGSFASTAFLPIGHSEQTVFLQTFPLDMTILRVDVTPEGTSKITFPELAQHVSLGPLGQLVTYVVGSEYRFRLLAPAGVAREIAAEVAQAASSIPSTERVGLGFGVVVGDWIVFAARAGILGYRPRDRTLLPVQVRAPTDRFSFSQVLAIPDQRAIGFAISSEAVAGLYVLELDGILP